MNPKDVTFALRYIKDQFDSLKEAVRNQRIVTDISGAATALDKAAGKLEQSSAAFEKAVASQDNGKIQSSLLTVAQSVSQMAKAVGSIEATDLSETNSLLSDIYETLNEPEDEDEDVTTPRLDVIVELLQRINDSVQSLQKEEAVDRTDEVIGAIVSSRVEIPKIVQLDPASLATIRYSGGGSGGGATTSNARSATSVNVSMASANTQYSYQFKANTIGFRIKLRSQSVALLYSWQSGTLPTSGDGSAYSTVQQNSELARDGLDIGGKTIYLQTGSASQVAEIEVFTLQ